MFLKNGKYFPKSPKEAKELLGKKIRFLENCDIDKSGRGYFFPQEGVVTEIIGRNIFIDDNPKWLGHMVEYEILEEKK
jgi:FKBP-type peptidyl-prolyl cis-trans isomerase 2